MHSEKAIARLTAGWEFVEDIAQDGSARSYARLQKSERSALLMNVQRDERALLEFIRIGRFLADNGVRVPEIYEADTRSGLALIEDLGRVSLAQAMRDTPSDALRLYRQALDILGQLKGLDYVVPLCAYQSNMVHQARSRVMEWYYPALMGRALSGWELEAYFKVWDEIEASLPPYKNGFVHGDFHVENLLLLDDGSIGVIDFQDAMFGSPLYDLGNLLEDMRADVPPEVVRGAVKALDDGERAWMRILTTQFHCRLLGQCLLWAIRMDKPQYLSFLPRLEAYVRRALDENPVLLPMKKFFADLGLDLTLSKDLNIDRARRVIAVDAL